MKGTIVLCTMAVVCALGYITMTHKAQTSRVLLEMVKDLNTVKIKISDLLRKKKVGEKVENVLSGDLQNIERKMEKINDISGITQEQAQALTQEKPQALSQTVISSPVSTSSIESMRPKTGLSAISENNFLSNNIVDQIIESYLKGNLPMETITKAIVERPELLALAPKVLGLNAHLPLTNNIRASEIPTTLMKNIINEQAEATPYQNAHSAHSYLHIDEAQKTPTNKMVSIVHELSGKKGFTLAKMQLSPETTSIKSKPIKRMRISLPSMRPIHSKTNLVNMINHMNQNMSKEADKAEEIANDVFSKHTSSVEELSPSMEYIMHALANREIRNSDKSKEKKKEKLATITLPKPARAVMKKVFKIKESEQVQESERPIKLIQEKTPRPNKEAKPKKPIGIISKVIRTTEDTIHNAVMNSEISTQELLTEDSSKKPKSSKSGTHPRTTPEIQENTVQESSLQEQINAQNILAKKINEKAVLAQALAEISKKNKLAGPAKTSPAQPKKASTPKPAEELSDTPATQSNLEEDLTAEDQAVEEPLKS
ncbi:uncharacterized protein NEPG_02460 [Nematocida parisii ERTm1]|uniref:uncharacterized protein n=1 Tax=Nematocida parisii (strain ERTm1 / ATCC PRA-289) TaxID=881290 RepID=UPI000264B91B|nr:uncharacterized protein NEPG_02460 [Nematocida parisii ERTm1]EIJ92769.1 hypothetical protein NEPG_02460 [Nematocida parisii ERTm1]KAI5146053.1 hypothetical protein NEPAR07_2069 [Nematocida parisii]|eukprot:XP_013060287.1 hypothetical protein NEPG_02460 [Nematocida parisii ERTm1]